MPALVALGIDGGFPAYRTMTARGSLQARFVGVALRAGYGPGSGVYGGVTLRGYPPIAGSPVPVWIGAGIGASAAGATPFAAVGVHVPVAPRWRVDLEAGAAWPELVDERSLAPHLSVGASYAFSVDLRDRGAPGPAVGHGPGRAGSTGPSCADPVEPDPALLDGALSATARAFVADARATYGSLYDALRYELDVRDRTVDGDEARLVVSYDGSVREIATGDRATASGIARVSFRWTGCAWRRTDLSY